MLLVEFVKKNETRFRFRSYEQFPLFDHTPSRLEQRILDGNVKFFPPELVEEYMLRNIMNRLYPEKRPWDVIIDLNALFDSEVIPNNTSESHYFDQRYIDFLSSQEDLISEIHWRQFELLTAEYFRRNGYQVEITPPRGDGGVDVVASRSVKCAPGIGSPALFVKQGQSREEPPTKSLENQSASSRWRP